MDLDLSAVDVVEFLNSLGVENIRSEMKEARFSCPYPAHAFGDKNPSAYMNLTTTAFICFGCGASGNAITFLADVKEVTRATAKNWIAQKWAPHYAEIDDLSAFIQGMFDRATEQRQDEPEWEPIDEAEIAKRRLGVDWHRHQSDEWTPLWASYILSRGFAPETLDRFEVCYDEISQRPCITVRSPDGRLVGFKGRAWREDQQPKYMVLGDTDRTIAERGPVYGFHPYDASRWVFGAHLAEPDVRDRLIVREGELNVIAMHQHGFPNTVGPSGSTLSDHQVKEIVSACEEVILFFDADLGDQASAATAKMKVLRAIDSFEPYIRVRVCRDHEGDPVEMTTDQVRSLIGESISSTLYKTKMLLQDVE